MGGLNLIQIQTTIGLKYFFKSLNFYYFHDLMTNEFTKTVNVI